jgi:hypothetical protein
MPVDLWSPDHWEKKAWKRVQDSKPTDFEDWTEARERYAHDKIQPLLQMYRQSDHDWFKDFSRRRGESMHSSDLIFRIQKLNPHVFVQQQYNFENDWGLYLPVLGRIQYLSAVPKGYLTEFSYGIVDEQDLPVEEKRGWRTVLIMCLCKGALSWSQVVEEFGEPQDGWNEARWCEATADIRHGEDRIWLANQRNVHE